MELSNSLVQRLGEITIIEHCLLVMATLWVCVCKLHIFLDSQISPLENGTHWFDLCWGWDFNLLKIRGREQDAILTSGYVIHSSFPRNPRMKMKGYGKWGGLPEILVGSFQLLLQGCTVLIATGLKLEGFPEEAHPNGKWWDAAGRITRSVPLESSFCPRRSSEMCPAGQQIQPSPPQTIWCDSNPSSHLIFHQNRGIFFTPERISLGQKDLWISLSWVTWEPKICVMSMLSSPETAECPCYSFVSQFVFNFFYIISLSFLAASFWELLQGSWTKLLCQWPGQQQAVNPQEIHRNRAKLIAE